MTQDRSPLTERAHTRALNDAQPPAFLVTPVASTPADELRHAATYILRELELDDLSVIEADNKVLEYMAELLNKLAGVTDLTALAGQEPGAVLMEILTVSLLLARSFVASIEADVES